MRIIKPRSIQDIADCVSLYSKLFDKSFIEPDEKHWTATMLRFVSAGKFFRIKLDDNDNIVAWISAIQTQAYHSTVPMLQQHYYASNREGVNAYRDVVDLHSELINEAIRLNLKLVISQGSNFDEKNTFTRILEKNGWERRGSIALKRLN